MWLRKRQVILLIQHCSMTSCRRERVAGRLEALTGKAVVAEKKLLSVGGSKGHTRVSCIMGGKVGV